MDEEIGILDQELCAVLNKVKPELWKQYDRIMSLINAAEDELIKESYIRGFLDYEEIVLGKP